jgi:prepilin-type N-terminal cleavage/methylation domain-containing protein
MPRINDLSKQGGFTLIELLVVISIIGVLSSVVLASLSSARLKAKDALIRQEVNQMRTLLELEYSDTGSYTALNQNISWIYTYADCDTYMLGNYASQAKEICKKLVDNASMTWTSLKLYFGTQGSIPSKYSIMVGLPGRNAFLCAGSSGAITVMPVGSGDWTYPGCWSNP